MSIKTNDVCKVMRCLNCKHTILERTRICLFIYLLIFIVSRNINEAVFHICHWKSSIHFTKK